MLWRLLCGVCLPPAHPPPPSCHQVGWADSAFVASSESGQGVGDDKASWAYDGQRILTWHAGSRQYGRAWSAGDVIGCAAFVAGGRALLSFSLNGDFGHPMGPAFVLVKVRVRDGELFAAFAVTLAAFAPFSSDCGRPDARPVASASESRLQCQRQPRPRWTGVLQVLAATRVRSSSRLARRGGGHCVGVAWGCGARRGGREAGRGRRQHLCSFRRPR